MSNDQHGNLSVDLERLSFLSTLPFKKLKSFRLLKEKSKFLDQGILFRVSGKKWFSVNNGKLSIHNYLLTLQAIFK